jgi:hypothetical protein
MVNNQYKLDEWLKIISYSQNIEAQFCYINSPNTSTHKPLIQQITTTKTNINIILSNRSATSICKH